MGRTAAKAMTNAVEIILERCHARVYKKKYIRLQVFTTYVSELDILLRTFGGNKTKHGTGWMWALHKRDNIEALVAKMDTMNVFPSRTLWEETVRERYTIKEDGV